VPLDVWNTCFDDGGNDSTDLKSKLLKNHKQQGGAMPEG
jgi:hypothetical protein